MKAIYQISLLFKDALFLHLRSLKLGCVFQTRVPKTQLSRALSWSVTSRIDRITEDCFPQTWSLRSKVFLLFNFIM